MGKVLPPPLPRLGMLPRRICRKAHSEFRRGYHLETPNCTRRSIIAHNNKNRNSHLSIVKSSCLLDLLAIYIYIKEMDIEHDIRIRINVALEKPERCRGSGMSGDPIERLSSWLSSSTREQPCMVNPSLVQKMDPLEYSSQRNGQVVVWVALEAGM